MALHQRDIAVRPNEIKGSAAEAGSLHSRMPGKNVEGQLKFGAGLGQAAARFSVYVDLPRQRS